MLPHSTLGGLPDGQRGRLSHPAVGDTRAATLGMHVLGHCRRLRFPSCHCSGRFEGDVRVSGGSSGRACRRRFEANGALVPPLDVSRRLRSGDVPQAKNRDRGRLPLPPGGPRSSRSRPFSGHRRLQRSQLLGAATDAAGTAVRGGAAHDVQWPAACPSKEVVAMATPYDLENGHRARAGGRQQSRWRRVADRDWPAACRTS